MKKIWSIFLALALSLTLTACGSSGTPENAGENPPVDSSVSNAPETAAEPAEPQSNPQEGTAEAGGGKTLIAYFSWSGNTEKLANLIQTETEGDLFKLEPETPYTDDYDALLEQAQQEQRDDARPALAADAERWDDYRVVFIGYPNWWGDTPMLIRTFLESHDFTGKTVVPFCTHGGSGFSKSLTSIEDSASGAVILDGFEVEGSRVDSAADDVADWIAGLALAE